VTGGGGAPVSGCVYAARVLINGRSVSSSRASVVPGSPRPRRARLAAPARKTLGPAGQLDQLHRGGIAGRFMRHPAFQRTRVSSRLMIDFGVLGLLAARPSQSITCCRVGACGDILPFPLPYRSDLQMRPDPVAAAEFIAVGRRQQRLDMIQKVAERTIKIEDKRLHFQRMANFVGMPPEKRILVEFLPKPRRDHEIDPLAGEFLRRRAQQQRFRALGLPDIGDLRQAFACDRKRPATLARAFLDRQYLD
jgi:hypothetical protein